MIESDADRLEMLKAVGAEEFDTGNPDRLVAVFQIPSYDTDGLPISVRSRARQLTCRESDIEAHGLIKQSPITRVADGTKYRVQDFDHDGTGMSVVMLLR